MSTVIRLVTFYLVGFLTASVVVLLRSSTKHVIIRHCVLTINFPLLGILARALRIKSVAEGDLVSTVASVGVFHVPKSFLRILAFYERAVIRLYNSFLVLTPSQVRLLMRAGFPECRVILKGFGLGTKKIPVYNLEDIPKNTFGFFGVLEKWQNVDNLLRAWAKVTKRKPSAKLFIVGDGSMKTDLGRLASDLKITESTVFLDGVPREILWNDYFRLFRVVVIPRSLKFFPEDAPMKLIEALAAGKPVIASRVPGIAAMVDERDGVVFTEPDNEESLALAICQLIDNDQRAFALSKQALKASLRFNLNSQLNGLVGTLIGENKKHVPTDHPSVKK